MYDGTDVAQLIGLDVARLLDDLDEMSPIDLATLLSEDGITLDSSDAWAAFLGKDAGEAKAVRIDGFALDGNDLGNYTLVQPEGVTAQIMARALIISGVGVADKVYDGTQATQLIGLDVVRLLDELDEMSPNDLATLLSDDGVTLDHSGAWAAFLDKNVGEDKAVDIGGFTLDGNELGNYTLVHPASVTANVTPAQLTVRVADATRLFGHSNPVFKLEYQGLVANEGPEVLTGNLTVTTDAGASSMPGTYALTLADQVSSENYVITLVPGVLTVLPSTWSQLLPDWLRDAYLAAKVDYYRTILLRHGGDRHHLERVVDISLYE